MPNKIRQSKSNFAEQVRRAVKQIPKGQTRIDNCHNKTLEPGQMVESRPIVIETGAEKFEGNLVPASFYTETDNDTLSRALLGKVLIRMKPYPMAGMIVETESYPGGDDRASHHWGNRNTDRTKVIFEKKKGLLYVYTIYGLHHCFGITSGDGDQVHNVTCVRALQPLFGFDQIKKEKGLSHQNILLNGPAKVAKIFNVTKAEGGMSLYGDDIILCDSTNVQTFDVDTSPRIGIGDYGDGFVDKHWRFFIKGNKFKSK